ncbi:MAG: DNA polymerase III subunit delta' [Syntrophobacterales bacterium]|nr:DNA polymerase III subunit delta' [Syntrophobacterales bacterium]
MSFENIYGQNKQIAILKRAIETGRVAHAYLFHGMKGIGKKTTARTFAKAMNCKGENIDSCDKCSSCAKIDRGFHPDVITVEPKGVSIRIQDIRDLQNQMKFKPFEGEKRIFIIVDAEKMNGPSANALLKTLEEPNPSNILILITSRPYQLPATIISRCQKIRFDPIRRNTLASFLENSASLDSKSAWLLAPPSRGSIGNALEMMKRSYLSSKNEVIEKIVDYDNEKDPLVFFTIADCFGENRKTITEKLDTLRDWYRDMLVYKETKDPDILINQDILNITKRFSEKLSGHDILRNIKTINLAYRAIEQNANKQLTLESMMFKLLNT